MADLPPYRDTADEGSLGPDRGEMSGTPRWVKVFGIIILVVILLFVISLLAGVRHGPDLHTPPSSVIEDYTPPGADLGGHAASEGGHG